jgi:hypothetical protein
MQTLTESDNDTSGSTRQPWTLPVQYVHLTSREQAAALRSSILLYLQAHGSAAKSVLVSEIRPPRQDTFQRALDFLATTQQVYLDSTSGSRDPTYHSNGRLAHPSGQRVIDCIRYQYAIRSYDDRWAGKTVTITQYAVLPSGEKRPVGGIRIDREDVRTLIEGLKGTIEALEEAGTGRRFGYRSREDTGA